MTGGFDAEQGRGQRCTDRAGIHPAIRVTAHGAVHGTMVHAGPATDAAQHFLGGCAQEA